MMFTIMIRITDNIIIKVLSRLIIKNFMLCKAVDHISNICIKDTIIKVFTFN